MASLGDLTLFVSAETDRAQKNIQGLGKEADKVSGKKREIDFSVNQARNNIKNFKRDIASVGDALKAAYKVGKMEGFFDDEIESAEILSKKVVQVGKGLNDARKPGEVLTRTFNGIAGSAVNIVNSLAKVGFALYGIQQITGVLKQAFGGMFNTTIGESIRLQESILKTQTSLASTNDVLRNGEAITDPYEAIVSLTGTIEQRIASIRDRSLELAGVTSNEVIEVFGMVAQQVGNIGGSLKDAEDLAISFAGALGTFGIPLHQARQEIGSILRGNITTDSYLAKALGITNKDVQKARSSTEGLVGFLEGKLSTAVAGQKIAAEQFSGVLSNIADFKELIGQAFGDNLLQPTIDGLTTVYNILVSVKDQMMITAAAVGQGLGRGASILGGAISSGASAATGGQAGTQKGGDAAVAASKALSQAMTKLAMDTKSTFNSIATQLTTIIKKVSAGLIKLGSAFVGLNVSVFTSLLETFNLLVNAVSNLASPLAAVLSLYGSFLQLPLVENLASTVAQFKLLETIGVSALVKVALTGGILFASFAKLKAIVATIAGVFARALAMAIGAAGAALQGFGLALTALIQKLGVVNPQLAAMAARLTATGVAANSAAAGMGKGAGAAAVLGKGIRGLMFNMLKFNLILLGVQLLIAAVVQSFAAFQKAAKEAQVVDEFNESLQQLNTTFKDVNDSSTAAQKAMKAMADANAQAGIKALTDKFKEADKAASEYEKKVVALRKRNEAAGGGAFGNVADMLKAAERGLIVMVAKRLAAEKQMTDAINDYAKTKDRERLADEISTRKKEFGKLNDDLAKARDGFNRAAASKEFNARQDVARKELELFTANEEIKIRIMERRNRQLVEGEEGASATALKALNTYLAQRKRGELDIENQKQSLIIANADVEEQIANYKFDIERKIAELKKKGLEIAVKEAELAGKRKEAEEAGSNVPDLDAGSTVEASGLGLRSAGGFAAARRNAQGIADQLIDARGRGQDLTNQENLDAITKGLLPTRALEGFRDSIIQADELVQQLSTNLNPEQAKLAADLQSSRTIIDTEVVEALETLRVRLVNSGMPEVFDQILADTKKRYAGKDGILEQLAEEAKLRGYLNKVNKQAVLIEGLKSKTLGDALLNDQKQVQGSAMMAQGQTVDLFAQGRIGAQSQIEQERLRIQSEGGFTGAKSEEVTAQFQAFSEQKLFDAERQAEMDGMIQRFERLGEISAGVGQAISTAFTQGFADILSGAASVQDVLGNMFKGIADSFMQMATKIIADMIKMMVLKSLLGLFGGGSMPGGAGPAPAGLGGGGGGADSFAGVPNNVLDSILPKFAKGGIVTGPTTAMIGEGGMNEAVVPLPNGRAIPVDFGKKGKMGGGDTNTNITVNVDQSGNTESSTTGDSAGKLGKAIDGAVKRVIMEERRSGGLLHNGGR